MVNVRRGRFHPAQREVAATAAGRAGPRGRRRCAQWFAAVTCGTTRLAGAVGEHGPQQPRAPYAGCSRRAARAGPVVDVGVARSGAGVGDEQPARATTSSAWSGPCAAPRVRRSRESIRSMSAAEPSRTLSTTGIADRSTSPRQEHLRVQRRSRPRGRAAPPWGPTRPRACRAGSRDRGRSAASSSWRPMPWPCRPGRTAYVARHHSSSRRKDVANPTIPVSSSATQQPPGSVSRKCRVRSLPAGAVVGGAAGGWRPVEPGRRDVELVERPRR